METKNIRMILRAIELKSLSKAAEEFNYTPSAFKYIADGIEQEIGAQIFVRTHSGIELTDIGKMIRKNLEKIIKAEDELLNSMSATGNIIRIGTYSSISKFILPKLLKGFKEEHAEVGINIIVGNVFKGWLAENKVDIVFSDEYFEKKYTQIKLFDDKYVLVVPKNFPQYDKIERIDDIYGYTFIMPNELRVKSHFDADQFKETIEVNSNDDSSILQMVKEGIGITVLPRLTLKNHMSGIKILKVPLNIERSLSLWYSDDNPKIKSIKKFALYLKKYLG